MISVTTRIRESSGGGYGEATAQRPDGITFSDALDAGMDALRAALLASGWNADEFVEEVHGWASERRTAEVRGE